MNKQTKKQIKKQTKLLEKSVKKSVKQALKAAKKSGDDVVHLDKKALKALTDKLVAEALPPKPKLAKVVQIRPVEQDPFAFARKPLKKSPCKRCPALSGGLCACAMKREKKHSKVA
ncbi:hypothetical protein [Ferrimonas aestuarii]|uniref:Uncharacterized protein n=1 Tax=Ferrimonas aestuarii TaxID=2569539 RepID=A0A4V5NXM6_9GAMM|nr:hypothetical protein [Ferrimonas aestuarii]TKB49162.1 hypothetical protein FCL42_20885 [Ferrimonas aestuarii]